MKDINLGAVVPPLKLVSQNSRGLSNSTLCLMVEEITSRIIDMKKLLLLPLLLSGCSSTPNPEIECLAIHKKQIEVEKCISSKRGTGLFERISRNASATFSSGNSIHSSIKYDFVYDAMMIDRMEIAKKQDSGKITKEEADLERKKLSITTRAIDREYINREPVAPVINNTYDAPSSINYTSHHIGGGMVSTNCM